jgi:hypothetical protein
VIALAVLAFGEIRDDDRAAAAQRQTSTASNQHADEPAPEPDAPAIVTAAVGTTAQTVDGESMRQAHPAFSVVTVSPQRLVVPHTTGAPRFLPLLI